MAFMSFKLCVFLCFCLSSSAFLLDTTTPARVGHIMTDDHYESLLKLFMDEHNARIQLQQEIVLQQQQIAAMTGIQLRIERLESTTATIDQRTNSTVDIYEKYSNLEKKYEVLLKKQLQLQDNLKTSQNRTTELEKEVENLKHIQTINQLQTLSILQQEVHTLQQDVNLLTTTSQARGQDLTAIYGDVVQNKQKLILLVNATDSINDKLLNSDIIQRSLSTEFKIYRNTQSNITDDLNLQIKNVTTELVVEKEFVGLTAFGQSAGGKANQETMKFPDIKMSYGVAKLSPFKNTGVFTCEKEGLYLVIVTITAKSVGYSMFSIFKNGHAITSDYLFGQAGTMDSGTGSILVQLNDGDHLYIKITNSQMNVRDINSSFTAVKLK